MENTIENARKFLEPNESCQNTLHWSPEVLEFMSKKLVAYAASIRPAAEVVVIVPSEAISKLIGVAGGLVTDRLSEDPQEWHDHKKAPKWLIRRIVKFSQHYNEKNILRANQIKEVADSLRRLNPTLTFTDETK